MSYEDLQKQNTTLTPTTKPKEELPKVHELKIPSKKEGKSFSQLAEQLAPQDQDKLEMIQNYDKIKKSVQKNLSDPSYNEVDLLADQNLATKKPDQMASLKKKVVPKDDMHLMSLPKKI